MMRLQRIIALVALLSLNIVTSFSQNIPPEWRSYTRDGYYYSVKHESNKNRVSESEFLEYLLGLARADVAKQIKINISDASTLEKSAKNGVTNVTYTATSNFSTDVTLRYVETRTFYDKKKREGYAIAWLSKEDLQNIYAERADKVISMLDVSARAEREHKFDDALKYAYWALVLAYTLPEDQPVLYPKPIPGQDASGSILAKLYARHCIEAILDGLNFKYVGFSEEDPLLGYMEVTCNGEPVASLDYTYNDGLGISPSTQAKDGTGIIEFRSGMDVRNIDIQVEYAYEDESNSDPEMKIALGEVSRISFPDALKRGIPVSRKKPRPARAKKHKLTPSEQLASEVSAKFEQLTTASTELVVPTPNTTIPSSRKGATSTQAQQDTCAYCLDVVGKVVDAINGKAYSDVKDLFTEEGYEIFEKLLCYGNAKILDRSNLQAIPYAYGYVCRCVPMKFSFKTNKKSFVENVVFWWDKQGKIDNLTFALDAESVKGILSKTQWTDGAKMAIISFLENYKTAFALARLDYIDAIFSEDALIIVGRVVKKTTIENGIKMHQEDVEYNRYTKAAYLSQLRRSFASKEYVNLKFANTEISKLTRGGHENFYGIQLKQDYFSSNYGDSGYLYLLVDMEDSRKPIIYVRTWQPQPDPDFGLYGPGNI